MMGQFIKNVLVPERIGSYYLIPQRILGFDINKTSIHITQLVRQGKSVVLEKFIDQPLELEPTAPYNERISSTIRTILSKVDRYDSIRSSIASSTAIFKELKLPFTDPEKISMVLNFEIEPFLPFPITQTIVDFIITQTNATLQQSTVLAAAVKKEYITEHISYFEQAGVNLNTLTVDLFDLYGLYKYIPRYAQEPNNNVLIDIGFNAIRIAYIVEGKLTLVRTLSKGISAWAKNVSQLTAISPQEALEKIIRFGLEHNNDQAYNKAIKESVLATLTELRFTLDSFIAQTKTGQPINKIFLLGQGAEIATIESFFNNQLHITCELFEINELLKTGSVSLKNENRIPRYAILSLSTALITPTIERFNLLKQEFEPTHRSVFYKQISTATLLLLLVFGSMVTYTWWQVNMLKKTAQSYESEIATLLNKRSLAKSKNMNDAIKQAEEKVSQEESIWFAFSSQTRFSFLKYLQDISTAIDREAIGLVLKKLVITEQEPRSMVLEGEVADFDSLKILEHELKQSNLFTSIPSIQSTKFSLTLPFKKAGEPS